MNDKKPAKKKKSMTQTIKELRVQVKIKQESYDRIYKKWSENLYKIRQLQMICPYKFFKINYSVLCEYGHTKEFEEIIEDFTIGLAIKQLKETKIHPDSFKLLNIQVLA